MNQTTNVICCPHCSQFHQGVEVHEISQTTGSYSHWAMCPTINAPIMMRWDIDGVPLDAEVAGKLVEAQKTGEWMVALFRMETRPEDGRQVRLYRKTSRFPKDQILAALDLFAKNIEPLIEPPQQHELPEGSPPPNPFSIIDGD